MKTVFVSPSRPLPLSRAGLDLAARARHFAGTVFSVLVLSVLSHCAAQSPLVNVTTWRYDNTHSGANTHETLLTPANVNGTTFGKLFSISVDGFVYGQPLYVSGLRMPDGLIHNVLFVVTQHDSVYAFDADSNGGANAHPLWQASLLTAAYGAAPGATPIPNADLGSADIAPEIGIVSTPVIDPATNTMYVVAGTKENGGYVQRLHAINIITGAEANNGPAADILPSVPGTGHGSANGSIAFSPKWQMNRVALDLFNGYVYVAFGSHGDNGPWHGWLMSFNAKTLALTSYVCLSPQGFGSGLWAASMPIDTSVPNGRLFLATGNGTFTGYPPLNLTQDYGDTVMAFDLKGGILTPTDAFTPFNQEALTDSDFDLGSSSPLLLPDQPGPYPHELIQAGKEGRIMVLNRDALGGYAPNGTSNTNALQDITGAIKGIWTSPAYWNGHVYIWPTGQNLKRFDLTNGVLSTTATSISTTSSKFPGATAVISSNGTSNGVLWAIRSDGYDTNGSETLYAFDPLDVTTPLYESDTNPARDDAGPATKFVVPVVANGKVYAGAAYQVDVYGLFNGQVQAAAPVITPNGGSFLTATDVTISTATPSATIYYTTDGSVPSPSSQVYTGPIAVSSSTTIRAIASAQSYLQSPSSSAVFTFQTQTPSPVLSPAAGSYTSPLLAKLTDSISGASIFYTTDGSTPTVNSTLYTGPFPVTNTASINAIATYSGLTTSAVTNGVYTIQTGGTGINFGDGFAEVNGLTLNGSTVNSDDSRLQLTTGRANQAGSVFANTPLNITSFVNDFTFQLSNPAADGFTFTIQNVGPKALGPPGGGLGYGANLPGGTPGIPNSIAVKFDLYSNASEGPNSTGLYENGASPTTPAIPLTPSGINLHSGDSMAVHMNYDGSTLTMTITDPVANTSFSQAWAIDIPQVIGNNSAYIGFTGGTGGATSSEKILTWTFVSSAPAVTLAPVIAPAGGTFTAQQSVAITDLTPSATIYYTLDGSTPSTSSPVYSTPLTVGNGTTKVSAIAVGIGASASAVSAATFVVAIPVAAAPVFSLAGGTYLGSQTVGLSDVTPGAAIYYTTDGSTPTIASALYSKPLTLATSTTLKAIAYVSGATPSAIATATYTIHQTGQVIDFSSGFPAGSALVFNGFAKLDPSSNGLELTDGRTGESGTAWATGPILNLSSFTSSFTFKMTNPTADGFTFALQSVGTAAHGSVGGGLGYGGVNGGRSIPNSVALKFDIYDNDGEGKNSIGVYTNGVAPTTPAIDLTGTGITLTSGDTFQVNLAYNGAVLAVKILDTNTSAVYNANFNVDIPGALGTTAGYVGFTGATGGSTVQTEIYTWKFNAAAQTVTSEPTLSPIPGSYPAPVYLTLTCLTPNSTIYYTVDGSQPSSSSAVYAGPIKASAISLTVKAFAKSPGLPDSPVMMGSYTMTSVVPAVNFTVANMSSSAKPFQVSATSNSPGAFTYTVVSGPATINGSTVTLTGTGTVAIRAIQAASGSFATGVKTATFTVTR